MRIALTGSAGTGRSTLARALAKSYNLPAIISLAREILMQDGYQYGNGSRVEAFLAQGDRPNRLVALKLKQENGHQGLVTDRAWIDLAAYQIIENHAWDGLDRFVHETIRLTKERYDMIFLMPWQPAVKSNGLRTVEPWYQFGVNSVIKELLRYGKIKHEELSSITIDEGFKECQQKINKHLNH